MDDNEGYDSSWNGFTDYNGCYHDVQPLWILTGSLIFIGTVISLIPQLIRLVRLRSSYGISPSFVLITSLSQFLGTLNYISLHNADFFGIHQITITRTIPRLLTFANLFSLWILYLPVSALVIIFNDRKERPNKPSRNFKKEFLFSNFFIMTLHSISLSFIIVYFIIGFLKGFGSYDLLQFGKVTGTISTFITLAQYIPQIVTTCKIKDNGSMSIITLAIQAPGGTANAIFMIFGNNDHWTTFMSTLSSAIQQWLLFLLCVYYKIQQRRRRAQYQHPLVSPQTSLSTNV